MPAVPCPRPQRRLFLGTGQTPTLAMVCRRYIENRDFSSVPYWKLSALMEKEGVSLKAIGITDYESEASAQTALTTLCSQSRLTVESVARKVTHTSPPLLYDLTALQKEANRRQGFSADKTLSIAQSLYEKKITTYPALAADTSVKMSSRKYPPCYARQACHYQIHLTAILWTIPRLPTTTPLFPQVKHP